MTEPGPTTRLKTSRPVVLARMVVQSAAICLASAVHSVITVV